MIKDYVQPDFYKFNTDSVMLAKYVFEKTKTSSFSSVGDYFCGCGVIGIELIRLGLKTREVVFVEKNSKFIPYLKKNVSDFLDHNFKDISVSIRNEDIFESKCKPVDLIVANPPYFYTDKSKVPLDRDRAAARFFMEYRFFCIAKLIASNLSSAGEAYVLYRPDQLEKEKSEIEEFLEANNFYFEFVDDFYKNVGVLIVFGCNKNFD